MSNDKRSTISSEGYHDGILYRRCPHCGEVKPISEFGLRAMRPDGPVREQSWCKQCRSRG